MLKWFMNLVVGSKAQENLQEPQERGTQIKSQSQAWQSQWHDYFDLDDKLHNDGESERPHPIPDNIDVDYRLIFGLSRVSAETRQKLFALFPEGAEMNRRYTAYLSGKPVQMSEADARVKVQRVIKLITEIGPNEDVDLSKIECIDRFTDEGKKILAVSDDITILLEGRPSVGRVAGDVRFAEVHYFLTEPLYASAGNYYQLHDWVTGVLEGGAVDQLYSELFELWQGGWQVFLNESAVILAYQKL